ITAGSPWAMAACRAAAKPRTGPASRARAATSASGRRARRSAISSALRARMVCRMSLMGSLYGAAPRPGPGPPFSHEPGAARRRSVGGGHAGAVAAGALDPAHAQLVALVPVGTAVAADLRVLGVRAPGGDRRLAFPVRHGDAEAVGATHRLHAQETGLPARQCHHALRGGGVFLRVGVVALRGE